MSFFYKLNRFTGSKIEEFKKEVSFRFNSEVGITSKKREQELIVTMTTVPERISRTYLAIESLLTQVVKPDRVILWVSDTISNDDLPANLQPLINRGLSIRYCKDVGPHTKIWHALKEYPDAFLVTADDDMLYHKQWLADLYESWKINPGAVLCHRALKITLGSSPKEFDRCETWPLVFGDSGESISLLATNSYGTMYAPGLLHKEVFNEKAMLRLCPKADDIWLKAMTMLNNIPVRVIDSSFKKLHLIPHSQDDFGLEKENVVGGRDNIQFESVMNYYDLWNRLR